MKKIILIIGIISIAIIGIYACSSDNSYEATNTQEKNNIFSKNPKYATGGANIPGIFTDGGEINLSEEQLNFILDKCSKNENEKAYFKNNLAYIGIFTKSNFDKNRTDNFDGVSLYIYDGNLMRHYFFQKSGNDYIENQKLTYKCDAIMKKDTSFIILYTKLYKGNKISHYLAEFSLAKNFQHKNANEEEYIDKEFLEFQTAIYAEYLKLSSQPDKETLDAIESSLVAGGSCVACGASMNGTCVARKTCRIYSGNCSSNKMSNELGNDYLQYFDNTLLYEIRDNVLNNSLVGEKYYAFYYYSSLPDVTEQLSLNELAQIAITLPTVYAIYERIKDSNYESLVFSTSEKQQILNVLNIYRSKEISANFETIISNIIADINALNGICSISESKNLLI